MRRFHLRPVRLLAALAILAVGAGVATAACARDWSTVRIGVDPTYKPFTYKTPDGAADGLRRRYRECTVRHR